MTVLSIYVFAYTNEDNQGDEDGNPPTNHWAISLEISQRHSIRLDMAPGYGSDGRRGKIEISSKKSEFANESIRTLAVAVADRTRVRTITDLVSKNKRQKYTFTKDLEGCRFWVFTIISDLENAGIVGPGNAGSVWEAVSYYWRYPEGKELRDVQQGTFCD